MSDETAQVAEPESIPEPKDNPLRLDVSGLLERGSPHEFLPKSRELELLERAAQKYVRDTDRPADARKRVREVWIEGKYRPAYQHFTPIRKRDEEPAEDSFG